jgi:predicted NAD-dependent protein-ADP-ribosyltransferase YbiA (DUF1768 family)
MVQSIINPSVSYPEKKGIEPQDKDHDSQLYAIDIFGVCLHVALGKGKQDYADKGLLYYPIYLTQNEKLIRSPQIGVFEVEKDRADKQKEEGGILDEEGDIDLNEVGEPLLFSFVPDMLEKLNKIKVSDDECDPDILSDKEDVKDDDDVVVDPEESEEETETARPELEVQTKEVAEKEKSTFDKDNVNEDTTWINSFLENPNFRIEDNEGGGDCLFAAIRDGLAKEGVTETVGEMRQKLADEATQQVYESYREHYDMYKTLVDESSDEISRLGKENREMKARIRKITDAEERKQFLHEAKQIEEQWKAAKAMKQETADRLSEVAFMKDITNLEDFKEAVQKCSFWGDTWAISTLEKALNVKLVLLSEEAYEEGDYANVLQCGQLNDDELANRVGGFNPDWYIMLSYNGIHYQVVTYKGYGAFKFDKLPYQVKEMIIKGCLERKSGPYYIISEVRDFMEQEGEAIAKSIEDPLPVTSEREESWPGIEEAIKASMVDLNPLEEVDIVPKGDEVVIEGIDVPPPNISRQSDCEFVFSATAGDRPYPGKAPREKCTTEKIKQYASLRSAHPNWRKKLSDEWTHPIKLQGKSWQSVTHYTLANRYKLDNPDFYMQFSLDSRSEMSKNVDMAKAAASKSGKYKRKLLRPSDVQEDRSYTLDLAKSVRQEALKQKFGDAQLGNLLKMTGDAKLSHAQSGQPKVEDEQLMDVRDNLNQKNIV